MAYGYNDGDQRRQGVRLAGRTTPTPRSATSSNPQRPQEQPGASSRQQTSKTRQSGRPSTGSRPGTDSRPGTSAQQESRLGARARHRRAEVPRLRRNGPRQLGIHINRPFSHPQGGRDGKPHRSTSCANASALPARRLRLALCSILACLVFVFMSSCMSHGSAGLGPTAEDKLLKAPVAPGYSFAFSTPRSQWQAGTMPHIYQIDPAWSELPYAGGTIRQNACGPTCLTMVYIFKTGHTDMTPVDMCALSEAGNYAPTGATEWSFMTSGAWQLGLNGTELHNDRDSMTQALRSGAPVIAAVRPGTFTNVGHYIVLYGIDDADQIGVYDPNSASRSARRWGVVEVLNEVEAMWAYY